MSSSAHQQPAPQQPVPQQPVVAMILNEKYTQTNESLDEIRNRVSKALANSEDESDAFLNAMKSGFVPAGRINAAAGMNNSATLINCFVQPVGDSVSSTTEGKTSIYDALREAAETMRRGGGVGYDFSEIRPKHAFVKGTGSQASGAISFMAVFNASCSTVESAGARRGAQMGVLRVDHPDIVDFINAKTDSGQLNNFNISVGITDQFMQAVEDGRMFDLIHKEKPSDASRIKGRTPDGKYIWDSVDARSLWEKIIQNTYNAAEPGVLFLDRINKENNLQYIEKLEATNPCGEQPLPDYGCCCLGSILLTLFVKNPFTKAASIDFDGLRNITTIAVQMLDRVLDKTPWPLEAQKIEASNKRRVGLGVLGLGNMFAMLGLRHGSDESAAVAAEVMETIRNAAYRSSIEMAKKSGAFPLFDAEKYLQSPFIQRLPEDIRADIKEFGIRNSHLISIAPTGTIALAFGNNASNGIEPPFALHYIRRKRTQEGSHITIPVYDFGVLAYAHALHTEINPAVDIENSSMEVVTTDYQNSKESNIGVIKPKNWNNGIDFHRKNVFEICDLLIANPDALPVGLETAQTMSVNDHLAIMKAIAPFVDAAISKTVNVPVDYPFADFKDIYTQAWRSGLKGITTYRPNATLGSVLSVTPPAETTPKKEDAPAQQNQVYKHVAADKKPTLSSWMIQPDLRRPKSSAGFHAWNSDQYRTPEGNLTVSVSYIDKKPFEVWALGATHPGLGAVAKLISLLMRIDDLPMLRKILRELSNVNGVPFHMKDQFDNPVQPNGIVSAFSHLLLKDLDVAYPKSGASLPFSHFTDSQFLNADPMGDADAWTYNFSVVSGGQSIKTRVIIPAAIMEDGTVRPCACELSGNAPTGWVAVASIISTIMKSSSLPLIATILQKLVNYEEPNSQFMAKVPGKDSMQNYISGVSYLAQIIQYRYKQLGIDLDGYSNPANEIAASEPTEKRNKALGARCPECNNHSLHKVDGCQKCLECGYVGQCG